MLRTEFSISSQALYQTKEEYSMNCLKSVSGFSGSIFDGLSSTKTAVPITKETIIEVNKVFDEFFMKKSKKVIDNLQKNIAVRKSFYLLFQLVLIRINSF